MAALHVDLRVALRHFALELTLDVGEEVVALAGPSGAGKTTVLRCVAGLRTMDAGRVVVGGVDWTGLPPEDRAVGYVPQHHALFPHLSVAQNVAFGGDAPGLLDRLGIAHLADARPATLSGGERQRVALARALARDPAVLLLDEPLASLDAQTRRVVRDELHDVLTGLSIPTLLVTHDAGDAAALARRVAVMTEGRLRQVGTPDELLERPADPFVVAFTGGTLLDDGRVVHPWDLAVGAGPGPDDALRGVVRGVAREGDRLRVRTASWTGEAPTGLALATGDEVHARVLRTRRLDRG